MDVPVSAYITGDQLIALQAGQDAFVALRQRLAKQLKVAAAIEKVESFTGANELLGDAGLPSIGTQAVPKNSLLFGMIRQPRRGAADADVRRSVELDRGGGGGCYFQQDQPPLRMLNRLEGEGDIRLQHLRQPKLQGLLPMLGGGGFKPGSHHGMTMVPYSPNHIAEVPSGDAHCVGDGGN